EYAPTIQISFQYVANWAAYMFPAAAIALAHFGATADGRLRQRAAIAAVVCGTVIANAQWGAYAPRGSVHGGFVEVPFKAPSEADRQRDRDLVELLQKVPPPARLCTSDRIQPHTTALRLDNWPLKSSADGCEMLLWSDLPGDMGGEFGRAALAAGTFELV